MTIPRSAIFQYCKHVSFAFRLIIQGYGSFLKCRREEYRTARRKKKKTLEGLEEAEGRAKRASPTASSEQCSRACRDQFVGGH